MTEAGQIITQCRYYAASLLNLGWMPMRQLCAEPPAWIAKDNDPLQSIYEYQERLLRKGRVVWGHLVQANKLLLKPGLYDSPANVLYSFDPHFDEYPQEMDGIARTLFAAKGKQVSDPELQQFGDELADETKRTLRRLVPLSLSNGREVVFTTIMVHRKHLPQEYLSYNLFPLLALPKVTEATLILPARYWPDELVELWATE